VKFDEFHEAVNSQKGAGPPKKSVRGAIQFIVGGLSSRDTEVESSPTPHSREAGDARHNLFYRGLPAPAVLPPREKLGVKGLLVPALALA
jgi:hypothetical protein